MPLTYTITDRNQTPPNGWSYTQPESGHTFRNHDFKSWSNAVRSHRKANCYDIPEDFEAKLINDACEQNLDRWGRDTCRLITETRIQRPRLGFKDAVRFLRVLQAFIKSGGQYVEQEVAEERAQICARCPHNRPVSFSCGACVSTLKGLLSFVLGKRTTWEDAALESCRICLCDLKSAVHFPLASQEEGLTDEMRVAFSKVPICWKKGEA